MYYIISLTHTMKSEKYLTLWRANNQGYCFSKENAGIYETPKEGYHDSDLNMPITTDQAEKLFQNLPYDNELKFMIPNKKSTWEVLNVRMARKHLKRINSISN